MTRPLERALILQVLGDVDVMFAGIDNATGDIILAGQTIVGLADRGGHRELVRYRRHPQLERRRRWPFGFWRFRRLR